MRALPGQRLNTLGAIVALVWAAGCSSEPTTAPGTPSGTGGKPATPTGGAGGVTGTGGVPSGSGGSPATGGSDAGGVTDLAPASDVVSMPPDDGGTGTAGDAVVATEGCGKPANQALARYVRKNTMVGNRQRDYSVYLPPGYDPMRPYRLVFLGHGCGGNGGVPFPFESASKGDAIVVGLDAVGPCFDVNGGMSTELPYFDQALKELSSTYCVDKNRVFMAGFSAGSWLANLLGCARAGVLRGQGNAEGNLPPIPACTGSIAAMMAHDMDDHDNAIAGSIRARDRLLAVNGCSQTTLPYDFDGNPATPSPCVIYQGCKPGYPVVWCPTSGKGHSPQVPITTVGLWRFWSQF
jgi:polyhydroxybutyrate depolymerase